MQPDVIDYSEYKKNASVAGLIAAFQGFFVKGGMGLTSFVIGVFLKNGGYAANEVQTEKALSYIQTCFIWIPVILCILIAALTCFYRLDGLRHEMTLELPGGRGPPRRTQESAAKGFRYGCDITEVCLAQEDYKPEESSALIYRL